MFSTTSMQLSNYLDFCVGFSVFICFFLLHKSQPLQLGQDIVSEFNLLQGYLK